MATKYYDQKDIFVKKYITNVVLSYFWLLSRKTELEEQHCTNSMGQNQSWPGVGWTHGAAVRTGPAEPPCWVGVWLGLYLSQAIRAMSTPGWPCLLFLPMELSLEPNPSSMDDQSPSQYSQPTIRLKGWVPWSGMETAWPLWGSICGYWIQDQPTSPRSIPQLLKSKGFDWIQKNYGNTANHLPGCIQPWVSHNRCSEPLVPCNQSKTHSFH